MGDSVNGVLKLKSPAPDSGVTISLQTDNPLVQELPPSVIFQAGEQEKPFSFLISQNRPNKRVAAAVPNNQTVTVKAVIQPDQQGDNSSIETSVRLTATSPKPPIAPSPVPTPKLASLVLDVPDKSSVSWGQVVKGTITLSAPAPSTGARVRVKLESSDPSLAFIQESVEVEPGEKTAFFSIQINQGKNGSVTITASYGGVPQSQILTVNPRPQ